MAVEIFGVSFTIPEVLLVVLFTVIAPAFSYSRLRIAHKRLFNAYLFTALLFLVSILISSYVAIEKAAVFKAFLKWTEIFGLSALVFLYCSSPKRFTHMWWLLVALLLNAIVTQGIQAAWSDQGATYNILRQLPDYEALFLLSLILPFSTQSVLMLLVSGVLAAVVMLSLTRGAWLAMLAMWLYWFVKGQHRGKSLLMLQLGILIVGITVFRSPEVKSAIYYKLEEAISPEWTSNRARLGMVSTAAVLFYENPLTGIGAENFSEYLLEGGIPEFVLNVEQPERLSPHNFLLQVAAETGALGLVAIVGWLWVIYRILCRHRTSWALSHYTAGLQLLFIVVLSSWLFGYVAGGTRMQLGVFAGLVLASLRSLR